MKNQDYFLFFLREKIDSGIKQIDIHRSTGISTSYINKLYRRPPKSCAINIQDKIADFFGLTYNEMIYEAKQLYKDRYKEAQEIKEINRLKPVGPTLGDYEGPEEERRSGRPENLIYQLNFVTDQIQKNATYTISVERQRNQLLEIINNVNTGFCIIDENLDIAYQNPVHTKVFGNKTSQPYTFFWDRNLETGEFYDKLKTGKYEIVETVYNKISYRVELSLTYKGNEITQIVEHVIPCETPHKSIPQNLVECELSKHIYKEILHKIIRNDDGFAYFNLNRSLEIASNKLGSGFLDKYDFPSERPTVDQLLLDLDDRTIENNRDIIRKLREIYRDRQETTFEMKMDGINYNLTTKRIYKEDILLGMLLIFHIIK